MHPSQSVFRVCQDFVQFRGTTYSIGEHIPHEGIHRCWVNVIFKYVQRPDIHARRSSPTSPKGW